MQDLLAVLITASEADTVAGFMYSWCPAVWCHSTAGQAKTKQKTKPNNTKWKSTTSRPWNESIKNYSWNIVTRQLVCPVLSRSSIEAMSPKCRWGAQTWLLMQWHWPSLFQITDGGLAHASIQIEHIFNAEYSTIALLAHAWRTAFMMNPKWRSLWRTWASSQRENRFRFSLHSRLPFDFFSVRRLLGSR